MLSTCQNKTFLAILKGVVGLRELFQFRMVSTVYEFVDICTHNTSLRNIGSTNHVVFQAR